MSVVVATSPAPDTADCLVEGIGCFFNTLDVSIEFETFKIGTHDHVDHTSYRIGSIKGRTTIGKYLDTVSHYDWDRVNVYKFSTAGRRNTCKR